ncbi:hypothetical protein DH2020_002934 [Rehmannia glutinosa]|uniref:Sulfotransferase n=1 Tax=Rehmannia glutinosa TaxID=99300 RepID=A0ABR0XVK6_REHGL
MATKKLSFCGSELYLPSEDGEQILAISLRQSGLFVRVENGGEKRSRVDTLMVFAQECLFDDQRDDMEVLDEPLYPNFLRVTGAERPYREELLSKMEPDGNKVVQEIIFGPGKKKYRFCKHMASQRLPGLPDELMKKGKHCILIRNPLDVLTSYDKVLPPLFVDLGYDKLVSIYSELCDEGKPPPVIDSDLLREDPEATLHGLCDDLGLPFQAAMLKWEPGPRPFDGVWAPYWLFDSAKALAFSNVPTREQVKEAIFKTLIRNGMFNDAHVRLTLTRGKKVTSGMNSAMNHYGCTLFATLASDCGSWSGAMLAEWKPLVYDSTRGMALVTAATRCNSSNKLDSKIHRSNLFNNILAKVGSIEGNNSHADDAIMFDNDGYVAETNVTNIFLVKKGHVATPHGDYCRPRITQATVFTTETMGELSPRHNFTVKGYKSAVNLLLSDAACIFQLLHTQNVCRKFRPILNMFGDPIIQIVLIATIQPMLLL